MRKHRLAGFIVLIFIYLADLAKAQDNFEDADNLSDLMSGSTGQQFDLRHTIPGIPDVDYPIYSEVPKTSFGCAGRHEGYYADIESRCQAFRICTHTARSKSGFGFLCPNGTLFSQKYFVCDWYRNVNCEDSERFFNKNDANRIGSSLDMMEAVRQMMEYPMKTISKALQQNPGSSRKPTQRHRGGGGNRNSNQQTIETSETNERTQNHNNSARKSVTRAQVESAHSRGTKKYGKEENTVVSNENITTNIQNSFEEKSKSHSVESSSSNLDEDVYVNSLGELSTDPGIHFDRTNAHIIAEPRRYRYEKHMNFAAKVNSALNGLTDDVPADEKLAPDYVKHMLSTSKAEQSPQIDLASNINGLLDEVANDLNPNTSGYLVQAPSKTKQNFRFLSRGFSSQRDSYKYTKPKQTASTVRFTPNQLPLDDEKEIKKPVFDIAEDAAGFGQSPAIAITTTEEPASRTGALDYSAPSQDSPAFEEFSHFESPLLPPFESDENSHATDATTVAENIITTTPESSEVYTVTPSVLDSPTYAAVVDTTTMATTTTAAQDKLETTTIVSKEIGQNLVEPQPDQKFKEVDDDTPIDEDRFDVNKQAEKLLFSGLKLTANENDTEATTVKAQEPLLIQVAEDHSYLTAWITSTDSPATVAENILTTTTEVPVAAEVGGSLQDRIRNYRRLASLQRATAKPVVYGKRGHMRLSAKVNTNTSTATTPRPTTTTRSYLKRVAASRLRLSRLAAAAGNRNNLNNLNPTTVGSLLPIDNSLDIADKKLSTRNIDKETAVAGNGLTNDAGKAQGIVTWESVRNSLQRFQVGAKKSSDDEKNYEEPSKASKPSTIVEESSTTARNALVRSRNRFSNFKLPSSLRNNRESSNNSPHKTDTTTSLSSRTISSSSSTSTSSNSVLPLSFLNMHHTSSQPQNLNSVQGSANTVAAVAPTNLADNTNLNSNSASQSSIEPNYISFDKLTRSIVDDSILQNYRAGQTLGRTAINPITATNGFNQALTSSTSLGTNALQVSSRGAYNNQVFATPAHQTFPKFNIPVPQKLTPQRPAHLPVYQAQTTTANLIPTTPTPRIVIARAEGQRIESNSVSSIISSLITQQQQNSPPKPTAAAPYMPLNDFLTQKFGQPTRATQIAATYYQQPQTQSQTQQQHYQQQQQQSQQNYRPSITQQYQPQHQQPQLNQYGSQVSYKQAAVASPIIFTPQIQQQHQQQLAPATSSLQPLMTQNIFASYQQQQQQLPQFPPLTTQAMLQSQPSSSTLSSSQQSSFQKLSPQFNEGNNFLNIQLPSLTNDLIPVPTSQTAQKRNDVNYDKLEFVANAPLRSVYKGASSYDVPLSSVGRLPNDIQSLLRSLRRH